MGEKGLTQLLIEVPKGHSGYLDTRNSAALVGSREGSSDEHFLSNSDFLTFMLQRISSYFRLKTSLWRKNAWELNTALLFTSL